MGEKDDNGKLIEKNFVVFDEPVRVCGAHRWRAAAVFVVNSREIRGVFNWTKQESITTLSARRQSAMTVSPQLSVDKALSVCHLSAFDLLT
jgi:hypothetical protein